MGDDANGVLCSASLSSSPSTILLLIPISTKPDTQALFYIPLTITTMRNKRQMHYAVSFCRHSFELVRQARNGSWKPKASTSEMRANKRSAFTCCATSLSPLDRLITWCFGPVEGPWPIGHFLLDALASSSPRSETAI
jgi:hypothetical protein